MDNQIKTSFIPHKPVSTGVDSHTSIGSSSHKSVGRTIFSLIATILFVGACAAYGATFLWEKQLESTISRQQSEMLQSLEGFDERFIKEATRLDTRIQEASKILANHVSPSTLFGLLSERTLETVAFSVFSLTDLKNGGLKLAGEGEAVRYESIVLQSDEFGRTQYLRNVLFTNLVQDFEQNRIKFSFEAQLDPRLIMYKDKGSLLNSNNQ